jgi:cystathionine beta-lyase
MHNFDKIIKRENTNSVKYDLREWYFGKKDVIPMWVADMDFATPECIRNAVKKRAEHPIYGYSIKPDSYFKSIINWMKESHQWDVKQNEISFSPGVVPGFTLAILAYSNPGDKIVVQPPVYFPFFIAVEKNGRELLHNQLIEKDNYYTIDFADLEKKLSDPKTKILLTSNPHNPVGRVWNKEELKKMLALCEKYNVLLLSDEIHSDLIFESHKHIPAAIISKTAKKSVITLMAPSKTFNMAGLSTSFLIIQDKVLKKKYEEILDAYHLGLGNIFGNISLEAAYNEGRPWLNDLMKYLEKNTQLVYSFLQTYIPEITFAKPEATYLLWLNCKALNMDDDALGKFFIEEASLGFNKGSIFGLGGEGFMRMNIACPTSTVEKALYQLKDAMIKYREE